MHVAVVPQAAVLPAQETPVSVVPPGQVSMRINSLIISEVRIRIKVRQY